MTNIAAILNNLDNLMEIWQKMKKKWDNQWGLEEVIVNSRNYIE